MDPNVKIPLFVTVLVLIFGVLHSLTIGVSSTFVPLQQMEHYWHLVNCTHFLTPFFCFLISFYIIKHKADVEKEPCVPTFRRVIIKGVFNYI